MWVHQTRLPHVLPPAAYFDPAHHERERSALFRWHFVATEHELRSPGAPVTRAVGGALVAARSVGGRIEAVASAHPQLARRGEWGLPCRVEQLGALVFVSLESHGPTLREHLDEATWSLGERLFRPSHRLVVAREIAHPCNWKIPLENVLESYHVPSLHNNLIARHPDVFKVFSGKRHGGAVVHELNDRSTSYRDSLGADSTLYRALIARLRPGASVDYIHHHAFPNVVFGHTSIVSFLQVVTPTSPTTSRSSIRLLLDLDLPPGSAPERLLTPPLRLASARLIDLVLREDAAVYPDVQRGMEASPLAGVLGSREERIHRFQEHVARACAAPPA